MVPDTTHQLIKEKGSRQIGIYFPNLNGFHSFITYRPGDFGQVLQGLLADIRLQHHVKGKKREGGCGRAS